MFVIKRHYSACRNVWYQLMNMDGSVYRGANRDMIPISSVATVREIKHQIYRYNIEIMGHLPDSSHLLLFESKKYLSNAGLALKDNVVLDMSIGVSIDDPLFTVVPTRPLIKCNFTFNEIFKRTFQHYQKVAEVTKVSKEVETVTSLLRQVENVKYSGDGRFIFVTSSLGSGKTQLAFSIMESLKNQRKVVYLPLRALRNSRFSNNLDVSGYYGNISQSFINCIDKDINMVSMAQYGRLEHKILFTFDFLRHLLSSAHRDSEVGIRSCSYGEIKATLKNNNFNEPPVVILDDFEGDGILTIEKLRFIRKLLQSLGFPLIIMSSDAFVIRDLRERTEQTRIGHAYTMCYVISKLPSFNPAFVPENVPRWLTDIIISSRPLFSQIALVYIRESPPPMSTTDDQHVKYLKALAEHLRKSLSKIAENLDGNNNIFNNRGQYFSQLTDEDTKDHGFIELSSAMQNVATCRWWNPRKCIPAPSEDALLNLIISNT